MKPTLKKGDPVTVRGNTYGAFQFYEHLPANFGGVRRKLCRVLHSSNGDFACGLIKTVNLSSVKPKP